MWNCVGLAEDLAAFVLVSLTWEKQVCLLPEKKDTPWVRWPLSVSVSGGDSASSAKLFFFFFK